MDEKELIVEKKGSVARITINRPEMLNAISTRLAHQMTQAIGDIDEDPEIKVIVITGSGEKAFSAGADLKGGTFSPETTPSEALKTVSEGHRLPNLIQRTDKIVVAAVNGLALGAGLELAMACDIIIVTDDARLGLPEINLGFMPGLGGTQRLPRLVGRIRANQIILTGEPVSGKEAVTMGLANISVPRNQFEKTIEEMVSKLAAKSAPALRKAKKSIQRGLETALKTGIEYEMKAFASCFTGQDASEGLRAFLEKRKPQFSDK